MRKERPWRNLTIVVLAALVVGFIASEVARPHEGHTEVHGVRFPTDTERLLLGPIDVDPETDKGTLVFLNARPNITMLHIEGQAKLENVSGDGALYGTLTVRTPSVAETGDEQRLFSCTTPTGIPFTTPTCDRSSHGFAGQFLERRHIDTPPDKVEYESDSFEATLRQAARDHTSEEHVGEWTFRFDVERDGAARYDAMEVDLVVIITKYQGEVTSWRGQ